MMELLEMTLSLSEDQRFKILAWLNWKAEILGSSENHHWRHVFESIHRDHVLGELDGLQAAVYEEILLQFPSSDSDDAGGWSQYCEAWRSEALAALPESERNDPNQQVAIDTTYRALLAQVGGDSTEQEEHWNQIAQEAMQARNARLTSSR